MFESNLTLPRTILAGDSGGNQKSTNVSEDSNTHGNIKI